MNLKETAKEQFGKRSLRLGSMTILLAALVVAIAIVLNIILSVLPVNYTEFDLTDRRLYTLTDTTEVIVSNLQTDIHIYVICEKGKEDSLLRDTLNRYKTLSEHLKVEYVDPILNPGFVASVTGGEYTMLTTENEDGQTVNADNSLIVTGPARYKVIYVKELSYVDYDMEEYMSAVLTGNALSGTQYYNAENMITAAIDYVMANDIPTYYSLFGHEEDSFSVRFLSSIGLTNIQLKDLDLLTVANGAGEVDTSDPNAPIVLPENVTLPADTDGLIIYNPKIDYNKIEIELLRNFLKQGGDLMLFTKYDQLKNLPNLQAFIKEFYGVTAENHLILETNSSYYAQNLPYLVIPGFNSDDFLAQGRVLMGYAHPLKIADSLPKGVTAVPILKAHDSAQLQMSTPTSNGFEIVDKNGGYAMAVAAEAQNENAPSSKFVWFPTEYIVSDAAITSQGLTINDLSSGTNFRYVISTLSWMSGKDATVAIDAIALGTGVISVTERVGVVWGIVLVGIVPGAIAVGGILYYRKRRAR